VTQNLGNVAAVREIFALLLSNHWMGRWQKAWTKQRALPPRTRRSTGKKKKKQNKKSPRPPFYQRIFSLRVTLWYLIFQRLNFDTTLAAVVSDLRAGGVDRLGGRGRQLSRKILSTRTSAYNQARQRLPLELLQAALAHVGKVVINLVGCERPRQILDGSTLAVLLTPLLAKIYPPAQYKDGATDWCIIRIVVGFCARSGAVLSAMEGAVQRSEQALAWALMQQAARLTIWIGDRNFGIWSTVAQAVRYQQDVLFRLTKVRAAKLCGGRPLPSGEERLIQWSASRHDQLPPGTPRCAISGRLIYLRCQKNGSWIHLWFFTTLNSKDYPLSLLLKWYAQRWQAELNFRSVKTHMKMAELKVCTPQMARKEFYAGLLAYSLVRAVMWKAGQDLAAGIEVLSFSQARRLLLQSLKDWGRSLGAEGKSRAGWIGALLKEIARNTLPKRRKQRPTEIRRVRHRTQKFPPFKGSRAAARTRFLPTKSW
jgi:hypothetical protein